MYPALAYEQVQLGRAGCPLAASVAGLAVTQGVLGRGASVSPCVGLFLSIV